MSRASARRAQSAACLAGYLLLFPQNRVRVLTRGGIARSRPCRARLLDRDPVDQRRWFDRRRRARPAASRTWRTSAGSSQGWRWSRCSRQAASGPSPPDRHREGLRARPGSIIRLSSLPRGVPHGCGASVPQVLPARAWAQWCDRDGGRLRTGIPRRTVSAPGLIARTAGGMLRLDSNENSSGPGPRVLAAIEEAFGEINRYPFAASRSRLPARSLNRPVFRPIRSSSAAGRARSSMPRSSAFTAPDRALVTPAPTFELCAQYRAAHGPSRSSRCR